MTLLVFGGAGQVASELRALLQDAVFVDRSSADLRDPDACAAAIRSLRPAAVINAAGYTAVDAAEADEATALVVNGEAPGAMARAAAEIGAPLVHLSTDYVFDGSGDAPFRPDAATRPLNAYGRSKLAGERAVAEAGGVYAILRTSWVFSAHGANFVRTMLRLSETRDRLRVVADQVGGPTPAAAVASACVAIARGLADDPSTSGTYHLSGAPNVSWADFAREIFAQANREVTIEDISSKDYPTPAARPLNSRLDCSGLATFGLVRPDWRAGLGDVLRRLGVVT